MNTYLDTALRYHAAGLRVIPFSTDVDGKKVFPNGYAKYRDVQTEAQVRDLFARPSEGVAILCTDGMEVIDIDIKHDPKGSIADDLLASMEAFGVHAAGVVQKTKSGGFHLIYRCPAPDGNQKLARRLGQKEAVIETRYTSYQSPKCLLPYTKHSLDLTCRPLAPGPLATGSLIAVSRETQKLFHPLS